MYVSLAKEVLMEALKFYVKVGDDGKLILSDLKSLKGKRVEVLILAIEENFNDLLLASQSSLKFWDNPIDDETWNDL